MYHCLIGRTHTVSTIGAGAALVAQAARRLSTGTDAVSRRAQEASAVCALATRHVWVSMVAKGSNTLGPETS